MAAIRRVLVASLAVMVASAGCGGGGSGGGSAEGGGVGGGGNDALEPYALQGIFTIQKPRGWRVITAGSCETLGVLLRDPADPLGQVFYFGTIAPVYLKEQQRQIDQAYLDAGGYQLIDWLDAPAVDPLTPENFLVHWPEISAMKKATAYLGTEFPRLEGFRAVATTPRPSMLGGVSGALTGEARGFFTSGGKVGEGMFLATVAPLFPFTGNPGQGTGWGFFICGVTASKADFATKADTLRASLESFTVSQAYVDQCLKHAAVSFAAVAEAGRTLSEASDILWEGWQARSQSEDIRFESWSDAYLGVERVYDPGTGTVYEVPSGWYQAYDPSHCQQNALKLLQPTDAHALWMQAPVSGSQIRC
jgi:hypothetical protein